VAVALNCGQDRRGRVHKNNDFECISREWWEVLNEYNYQCVVQSHLRIMPLPAKNDQWWATLSRFSQVIYERAKLSQMLKAFDYYEVEL